MPEQQPANNNNAHAQAASRRSGREQPRVSLVLATVGRVDPTMALVDSLAEQTETRFELIIVDQNNDARLDPVIARAQAAGIAIEHLRQEKPNLAQARNAGLAIARGEWVGFPDDDCWYEAETLSALVRASRSRAHGYVGSWVEMDDPMAPRRRRLDEQKWARLSLRGESAPSICLFLRRPLLLELGGFDERLGVGQWYGAGEETDLVMRALAAGARLEYAPAITVHHAAPDALPPIEPGALRSSRVRSRGSGALYAKHGLPFWRWLRTVVPPPLMLALTNPNRVAGFMHGIAISRGRIEGYLSWRWREHAKAGRRVAFAANTLSCYRWGTLRELARRTGGLMAFVAVAPDARERAALAPVAVRAYASMPRGGTLPGGGERTGDWAWGLPGLLWRERPAVLISGEFGARTIIGWIARRLRIIDRLVIHADLCEDAEAQRGRLTRLRQRLLAAGADAVVVNGASGERHMRELTPGAKILRIPYASEAGFLAFDARADASPLPAAVRLRTTQVRRFLFVGQYVHGKRIGEFAEALARVHAALPDAPEVELSLVGDGPLRTQLSAMAERISRQHGLCMRVAGPVPRDSLPAMLAAYDLLILPSAFETWGMVVNEAMAVGLPVLASCQTQAAEELVRPARNGWLFDARRDDPEHAQSMESAIQAALCASDLRYARMGRLARAAAESMNEAVVADRWYRLISDLAVRPAQPQAQNSTRLTEQVE